MIMIEHTLPNSKDAYGYEMRYGSVTEFDSADLLDVLKQKITNPKNDKTGRMQSLLPMVKRHYNMNRKEIEAMFTVGWQDGATMALELAAELEAVLPVPKDLRRALHYADHGDELMIDNLYAGRFDNLYRTRKRQYRPTQTVVTIGMHLCTMWTQPHQSMLSGAVGIALAMVLERYGYRVELQSLLTASEYRPSPSNAYSGYSDTNIQHVAAVKVKEAFAPLNAAEIAAVHHPATAHSLIKGAMARGEAEINGCDCNDVASTFAQDFMVHTGKRFDYCFDYIGTGRAAKRHLIAAVKSMGGTIFNQEDVDAL